tara:strand:+ start:315 stop:437 length:123 start_codon:yes stop_codon:yes gene_type:complete
MKNKILTYVYCSIVGISLYKLLTLKGKKTYEQPNPNPEKE